MKTALYHGAGKIELTEKPNYLCGDNGIILKNIYSGICGTDVAVYKHGTGMGHRITIGGEFGHETVCRVAEVGKNVKGIKTGERVYPYPLYVTGDTKRAGTIGGFSEYIYCPAPEWGKSIYHVPEEISDKAAALIEPFTVGCRSARRGRPQKCNKAIVFGAGTIGVAAAITLKYFGCETVVICDPSDFRLEICRHLGFETVNNSDNESMKRIFDILGISRGINGAAPNADIWIDAAGADSVLTAYEQYGKYNSRIVVAAVGNRKRETDILGLTFGQREIIGSGGYAPEDVRDVIDIMKSGRWDIEKMITHVYPWEELRTALEKAGDVNTALNVMIHF